MKFQLHWLGGKTEEVEGNSIADAFMRAGYGAGAVDALDRHEEINVVDVVFLRDRNDGCMYALFPGDAASATDADLMGSYCPIGQHCAAAFAYVDGCDEVTDPAEYAAIARELERIGYTFRVVSKDSIRDEKYAEQRRKQLCVHDEEHARMAARDEVAELATDYEIVSTDTCEGLKEDFVYAVIDGDSRSLQLAGPISWALPILRMTHSMVDLS